MPVWLWSIIKATVLLLFVLLNAAWLVLMERKLAAYMQNRLGPNRAGPWGILQAVADVAKLLQKEDIIPRNVDKPLFKLAPFVSFIPSLLVWLIIPFGKGLTATNMDIGIIFVAAVTGFAVIAIFMAGWGSNNKYSLMGAMRGAAQMISYEVTLVMSIIGVVMMAGSLKLPDIIAAQAQRGFLGWYIFPQIIGFVVYTIASLAELNRAPFDLTEAESELVAGYHTEYSGMRFGTFFLAEYANLLAWSAIAAACFLGGYEGPKPPDVLYGLSNLLSWVHLTGASQTVLSWGQAIHFLGYGTGWEYFWGFIWFILKTYVFVFLAMWIRWTLPRVRIDQLMDLGWKFLLPVSLFNLFITGVLKYLAVNVWTHTIFLAWWR